MPKYINAPDLYLVAGEQQRKLGISLVSSVRKSGYSTSYSLKASGFGKQFKEAGKSGARYALVLGEEEVANNQVKVKDLQTSSEKVVAQQNLIASIEEFDAEGGIPPST